MDSPIRKQLKRNDYLRHKVFRKISRRRRAEKEQEESMPERELRRRLRRMRKYGDGKDDKPKLTIDWGKDFMYHPEPIGTMLDEVTVYGKDMRPLVKQKELQSKENITDEDSWSGLVHDVGKWISDYVASPGYAEKKESVYYDDEQREKLNYPNIWFTTNPDNINYLKQLVGENINDGPAAWRDDDQYNIMIPPDYFHKFNYLGRREAHSPAVNIAHEFGHIISPDVVLDDSEQVYKKYPLLRPINYHSLKLHDKRPREQYSDILALRYLLDNLGIYDSKRSDNPFSIEHLRKVRDVIKQGKPNTLMRMLDGRYTDDQIIWLMNNIAQANILNNDDILYANSGKDSGIHIKPSKRGTFTAAAKRRGMTVKQLTSAVLRQPGKYSKAMRKKALFARNASKWKK